MLAAPLAALDLPLKRLLWEAADGGGFVSSNSPDYVADRYGLDPDHTERLRPIVAIADAITAR